MLGGSEAYAASCGMRRFTRLTDAFSGDAALPMNHFKMD
jgi:hypothetical protein